MLHGLKHAFTPGTPIYGALKMGALGSVFLLQRTVRKRSAARTAAEEAERERALAEQRAAERAQRGPHSRSKKKKRRR